MNNHIYLIEYGKLTKVKSDGIKEYCNCERLNEEYIRRSVHKPGKLHKLLTTLLGRIQHFKFSFEKKNSPERLNKDPSEVLNTSK